MSEISGVTLEASPPARVRATLPRRWWLIPLVIYAISRIVAALLIVYLSPHQYGFSPTGVHLEIPMPGGSDYLRTLTNWDGQWYYTIAEHGYPLELPRNADGHVVQNPWAFYPVYPFTVRAVMEVTRFSFPLAATIVSMTLGAGAVLLLYRLLRPTAGQLNTLLAVAALCAYPAAPLLQTAYTESTALFLLLLSLVLLRSRRYGWLLVAVLVLSLARPIALPLTLVIAWHWWTRWRRRADDPVWVRERWKVGGVTVATMASFGLWPAIAGIVTGVPNAYRLTQADWVIGPRAGEVPWPSWLFLAIKPTDLTPVVLAFFIALAVVILDPASRAWGNEIRAWGLAYGAYVIAATQATSSIIRYGMLLVIWWPFVLNPTWTPHPAVRRALISGVLVAGFITQYFWLEWFYIPLGVHVPMPINISCCYP
jgi:hypothetical protein